jgi:hypothetical protein
MIVPRALFRILADFLGEIRPFGEPRGRSSTANAATGIRAERCRAEPALGSIQPAMHG